MAKRSDESLAQLPEVDLPKRLPPLSQIADTDVSSLPISVLLVEAHALKQAEARAKAVKQRIRELVHEEGYGEGVRCLGVCAIIRWQAGRRSLSREKLIDNGVTPRQIEASMVEGEGYWMCELPTIEGI